MNKSLAVLSPVETPTMSSIEMVDYINADRKSKAEAEGLVFPCKKYRKLEHRSFMKKVPKVLGDAAAKFFATDTYINGTGGVVERDICNFPKREACLMAMSYSYELQAQVFDHMTELEGGKDINLLDFSGLADMAISEMQNRVAAAEKFSFEEHGQTGSALMTRRKKEKKVIKRAELIKLGYDQNAAMTGADMALDHYRRCSQASRKGKIFDDCLYIAKQWAGKQKSK